MPCQDIEEWGVWYENAPRHLAVTKIGVWEISTVFTGLNYQFRDGLPLVFETAVFNPCCDPLFIVKQRIVILFHLG